LRRWASRRKKLAYPAFDILAANHESERRKEMDTARSGIELALRSAMRLLSRQSTAAEGSKLLYRLGQIVERFEGDADVHMRAKQALRVAEQMIL
jgi:hypothetical protein